LRIRGFDESWYLWIKNVLFNEIVAIKLNDNIGPYFQTYKGVRQEDQLSPLLFNFVADCLTRMMMMAQMNNMVTGLINNLIPRGTAIPQYVDDTIICLEHNLEKERNAKLLLYMFEQMSGMKINFNISEVLLVGWDNDISLSNAKIFNRNTKLFPLLYELADSMS
jgi:hypothetical protein